MIRVLVVDDEEPARERLCRMLSACDDVVVVGEACDGEQALERIGELRPDLVLLDIQMPGCSGTEVAASLPATGPHVVFCTAYDEYAVEAFDLHALDYLLKPVTRARLDRALERVRGQARKSPGNQPLAAARAGLYPQRFLGKRGTRYHVVPGVEVLTFESESGQTRLRTGEHHYWMQPTLADLEGRLDPRRFFRVSRAALVNLDAVREVLHLGGGQGKLELRDGSHLEISRRRFKQLLERLEG